MMRRARVMMTASRWTGLARKAGSGPGPDRSGHSCRCQVDVYLPRMRGARPMVAIMRPGHHGSMESVLNVRPRQLRALGWAALFPAVMCLCFVCWGARPWTWIAVSAAAAVTLLTPAVAADLLAVALLGFASYAFAVIGRNETLPPGSGTTAGYPFHSVVFGSGPPHTVDLAAGLLMLTLGAWLGPRTIRAHSRPALRHGYLARRPRCLSCAARGASLCSATELRRIERDLHD